MIDENKFWDLIRQWEYDTRHNSSAAQKFGHPSINAVIQMGQEVIPLVLKAMKDNYHLTFVLHKLTGEWPVKDEYAGNGSKIIECWQKWANKHGYRA
jgi:predicted GTPase